MKTSLAAKTGSRQSFFEPRGLSLLSFATVGTAWCWFRAAASGGVSQRSIKLLAAASRNSVTDQLQSYPMALMDVLLFRQHINARAASNEGRARPYSDRLRGESKHAFESWMGTRPFENENAPAHPYLTNYHQPRLLAEPRAAKAESQDLSQRAGEAGAVWRGYVLITMLRPTALSWGGTVSSFEKPWVRRTNSGVWCDRVWIRRAKRSTWLDRFTFNATFKRPLYW